MMMATTELSPKSSAIAGKMLRETLAERGRLARPAGPMAVDFAGTLLPALWRPRTSRAPAADRFVRVGLRELAQRAALLIPVASVETHGGVQHRLRIRCKALRYSLEMMGWHLGAQAAWRLDILRKVQDELGELHDIDVFCGYLAERMGPSARHGSGRVGDIGRRLGDERRRHFERFLDIREELERAAAPVIF
jgi:CHAD domain-containing protein